MVIRALFIVGAAFEVAAILKRLGEEHGKDTTVLDYLKSRGQDVVQLT